MPRYSVEYLGKWACFSTITESFITEFLDKEKYEFWCSKQFKESNLSNNYKIIAFRKAISIIHLNRNCSETIKCLVQSGIPDKECRKIVWQCELELYGPIVRNDEKFLCPNCNKVINKNQKICDNKNCRIKFIWKI